MNISSFIYQWLKNIVVVFIIVSILNVVMPKGKMKRYIDHVIGLLIIFTIISPLVKVRGINFNLEQEVFNNNNKNISNYNGNFYDDYNEEIERIYMGRISSEVVSIIENNSDYLVLDVEVDIYRQQEEYGLIKEIKVFLSNNQAENDKNKKIKIEKIGSASKNDYRTAHESVSNDLKKIISQGLGLNKEPIYIYIKN